MYLMANSADPDQLASSEANLSGSTLFAKAVYILGSAGLGLRSIMGLKYVIRDSMNLRILLNSAMSLPVQY